MLRTLWRAVQSSPESFLVKDVRVAVARFDLAEADFEGVGAAAGLGGDGVPGVLPDEEGAAGLGVGGLAVVVLVDELAFAVEVGPALVEAGVGDGLLAVEPVIGRGEGVVRRSAAAEAAKAQGGQFRDRGERDFLEGVSVGRGIGLAGDGVCRADVVRSFTRQ